jgi:hypothetical protein
MLKCHLRTRERTPRIAREPSHARRIVSKKRREKTSDVVRNDAVTMSGIRPGIAPIGRHRAPTIDPA